MSKFQKVVNGARWRMTADSEGHLAGDVLRVVKFQPLTAGTSLDGFESGLVEFYNERTRKTTRHGACLLGQLFGKAEKVEKRAKGGKRRAGPVEFWVTQRDIDCGKAGDGRSCPIARAAHREGFRRWWACPSYIGSDFGKRFRPPAEAKQFMIDYDQHKPVKPFKLVLRDRF